MIILKFGFVDCAGVYEGRISVVLVNMLISARRVRVELAPPLVISLLETIYYYPTTSSFLRVKMVESFFVLTLN